MQPELFFVNTELLVPNLTSDQFDKIRALLYRLCGINLVPGKEGLVKTRLTKRLRVLGLKSFEGYLKHLEANPSEITTMVDFLTTNKTSFFREIHHFDYLRDSFLPPYKEKPCRIRFWSAGCSSGEEAYSVAILFKEEFSDLRRWDIRILATDISTRMLQKARDAVFEEDCLQEVPGLWRQKYFLCCQNKEPRRYGIRDDIKAMVRLARLNLMDEWPMRGPFDVIMCRNVMIYFDKPTQEKLVGRFWDLLAPGGLLLVGHSESLTTFPHKFHYAQPAVYVK
ncbi:MAG: protein-glutamate O-methyltransferase CheR [Acidobacteria bacterium]|nr:MAG: protein-glutamate O-methyltransferase CheR [Acidobacteriota bacterium]